MKRDVLLVLLSCVHYHAIHDANSLVIGIPNLHLQARSTIFLFRVGEACG